MNTKAKIFLAQNLYRAVSFIRKLIGRKNDRILTRKGGCQWELDLKEGIDFSIYLLGGFEPRTLRLYRKLLGHSPGEIVFDIGANIGAHTLPLAQLVNPNGGKVYAFEPTDYAYGKLLRNLSLNPILSAGVDPVQAMLVAEDGAAVDPEIYSSWPLGSEPDLHPEHGGQRKSTSGAVAFTLDSFVRQRSIARLDFIKLDVDGHEPDVLNGAWDSLCRFHPAILMEWSPHLFTERPDAMPACLERLLSMGYTLFDGSSGREIIGGHQQLNRITPEKGSMNILLYIRTPIHEPKT